MSTFVLVHGAWHGGWCWERLTPLLEDAGHRVTTPTLTGLGERCDLASAAVDLDTHIEDVLRHLEFERASDVVLVAHSYAGFVAFGVAERAASAIESLVLLDAFIPCTARRWPTTWARAATSTAPPPRRIRTGSRPRRPPPCSASPRRISPGSTA
jgi:pimeloyl-ACP methyl ester carboxylesterase